MIDTLVRVQDRYFLELDRSMLARVGIDPGQPVEVSAEGQRLIVTQPEDREARARFLRVLEETGTKHAALFRRLAQH